MSRTRFIPVEGDARDKAGRRASGIRLRAAVGVLTEPDRTLGAVALWYFR